MVKGIEYFRKWFEGYEDQYTIIGGTACDLLMGSEGLTFRATKDIDLVLIVEAMNADFGVRFWKFVNAAGYEHRNKSTQAPQFYRFTHPTNSEYPMMIELFARKPDVIQLPSDAVLVPLPIDESISSLSAILLDDDYYEFLKNGRMTVSNITILDAVHLIPFKAKAWIDLTNQKTSGKHVDSRDIRKHKNDVFRLSELLEENEPISLSIPQSIKDDMQFFIQQMRKEKINVSQLGIVGRDKDQILSELEVLYCNS